MSPRSASTDARWQPLEGSRRSVVSDSADRPRPAFDDRQRPGQVDEIPGWDDRAGASR